MTLFKANGKPKDTNQKAHAWPVYWQEYRAGWTKNHQPGM